MKKQLTLLSTSSLFFLLFFSVKSIFSQEKASLKNIDSSFINYVKAGQEVVYTHLNKSTYIKGESIGFTSYVFDKASNTLSSKAKNLYCVITNDKNEVIKEQLLEVNNGIASNVFNVDSEFTKGTYVFKSYTNWMLNFKEQNYFVQKFRVIDPEEEKTLTKLSPNTKLDVQFLPEGGHLVANTLATVGVIVKDSLNNGVANASIKVLDDTNKEISSFKVNGLGIGRFSFTPITNRTYKALIEVRGKTEAVSFNNPIESKGISLKVSYNRNDVFISLLTNKETLSAIQGKEFTVATYNQNKLEKIPFTFKDNEVVTKKINLNKLASGLNVFTLFNQNNESISERLFFNYKGISFLKSEVLSSKNLEKDSTEVNLYYKDIIENSFNNVSVSILPLKTKSYDYNNTIISQVLIQPYIKGRIENGAYYFKDINSKKQFDLDNLLLTQGWSSYDWTEMFKEDVVREFKYESGIDIQLNVLKSKKKEKYLFHHTETQRPNIVEVGQDVTSFNAKGYLPKDKEELHISKMSKKGVLLPAKLEASFTPNSVPNFSVATDDLNVSAFYYTQETYLDDRLNKTSIRNTQQLDEVVVKADTNLERIEKIKEKSFGNVYFFNEEKQYNYPDILPFFRSKGFLVERTSTGGVDIRTIRPNASLTRSGYQTPAIFINDILVDSSQLLWLQPDIIDYIDINKSGTGENFLGANGAIRIYISATKLKFDKYDSSKIFKFPLTFSKSKRFYKPIYQNYDSKFYQNFGTIDWLPTNRINSNGRLNLKFENKYLGAFRLFIEGITKDGRLIVEEKVIYPANSL
jgi:hypothetical protein